MENTRYSVIISNETGKPVGYFSGETEKEQFDPCTALGDLLNMVTYEKGRVYENHSPHNYTVNEDYWKHPLLKGKEFQRMIAEDSAKSLELTYFRFAVNDLAVAFGDGKNISLTKLEVFKAFYSLRFTSEIEYHTENLLCKGSSFYQKFVEDGIEHLLPEMYPGHNFDEAFYFVLLDYNNDFDMSDMRKEFSETPLRLTYHCHSLLDVIFSVWHYLIFYGYKFEKCLHCGNYFATQSLRFKYCTRKSPYKACGVLKRSRKGKGYNHLECRQAKTNIIQQLRRKQEDVYRDWDVSTEQGERDFKAYQAEYDKLREKVDWCASVENLSKLDLFLDEEEIRKNWSG